MAFEPGTVVSRYEIESLIAVGGMGEVYHARDHELSVIYDRFQAKIRFGVPYGACVST
jgi:hypothetical protein